MNEPRQICLSGLCCIKTLNGIYRIAEAQEPFLAFLCSLVNACVLQHLHEDLTNLKAEDLGDVRFVNCGIFCKHLVAPIGVDLQMLASVGA